MFLQDSIRSHDSFYLEEDRRLQPKELFKQLASIARVRLERLPRARILDVGCATGDFCYYLRESFPAASITGIDVIPELINKARIAVQNVSFVQGNICSEATLPCEKFDAVFMSGVHCIFDEFEPWIDNVIKLLDHNAYAYIAGPFNPENVDVLVRVRYSLEKGPWQQGWNIPSQKSISHYLKEKEIQHKFVEWEIPIDLIRDKQDPLRSWTIRDTSGKRLLVTGHQSILPYSILEMHLDNNA